MDGTHAVCAGDGGSLEMEALYVDELAELRAVGEDDIGVAVGEGDVSGVGGIGELDVEAMAGPEIRPR